MVVFQENFSKIFCNALGGQVHDYMAKCKISELGVKSVIKMKLNNFLVGVFFIAIGLLVVIPLQSENGGIS